MKRYIVLTIILAAISFVLFWGQQSNARQAVGIVQFIEHPALDTARAGLVKYLNDQGYFDGKNIDIVYESAKGDPALAAQISQKFVGQKVDVIVALGTTPAQTALQNVRLQTGKSIPVVFASVTDPREARLMNVDKNGKLYGDMICGISDYVPPVEQFRMFRRLLPNLLNLGVIYNPGEANSAFTLGKMEEAAKSFRMNIISMPASKTSEVMQAAHNLVGKIDAIFINNDNTALAAFDAIVQVGKQNKIPIFVSDIELADKALATLGPDQARIGEQAGEFVEVLLKGTAKPHELGVRFPEKIDLVLNQKFAKVLDIHFNAELVESAEKIITESTN